MRECDGCSDPVDVLYRWDVFGFGVFLCALCSEQALTTHFDGTGISRWERKMINAAHGIKF